MVIVEILQGTAATVEHACHCRNFIEDRHEDGGAMSGRRLQAGLEGLKFEAMPERDAPRHHFGRVLRKSGNRTIRIFGAAPAEESKASATVLKSYQGAAMVMTVLEAHVAPDRVGDLERAYREGTSQIPPDIVETFLVRDSGEASVFRIMTVWVSREALEKMRASGAKPKGVQIFEAAGAAPKLSIQEVVVHRRP